MPKLTTFIYSDNSRLDFNNGKQAVTISNPMLIFKPAFIPSTFSFAVTMGILGVDESVTHNMRYIFKKINSEDILIDTGEMQISTKSSDPTDVELPFDYRGFLFNMDFRNVVIKSEGEYVSYVYFDSECLGEFPIYVKGIETHG